MIRTGNSSAFGSLKAESFIVDNDGETTFTVTSKTIDENVLVFLDDVKMEIDIHFTRSGQDIVFVNALLENQRVNVYA